MARQLRLPYLAIVTLGLFASGGCRTAAKHADVAAQPEPVAADESQPDRPSESDEPYVATTHRTHPWVRDPRESASPASWTRNASAAGSC